MYHKLQGKITDFLAGIAGANGVLLQKLPLIMKGVKNFKADVQYFFF
jgi:hypothetical protein